MGMTIHFKGQLFNEASYQKLMAEAHRFAKTHHFAETPIAERDKPLSRVTDDEKSWDYVSDVKGVRLDVHPDSEPLFLEFDNDLYVQEWIKTQFAGAHLHALVINLLRRIQPLFLSLQIFDETGFWDEGDFALLEQNLAQCQNAIEEYTFEHPGCSYKSHTADGRIVDVIT